MSKLVVLFNLKDESARAEYEAWAQATDLPIVRKLPSVESFEVYRVQGLLGSDDAAPYQYVETIDIGSLEQFGADVSTDAMGQVAAQFREFADNPVFMLTNNLEAGGAA